MNVGCLGVSPEGCNGAGLPGVLLVAVAAGAVDVVGDRWRSSDCGGGCASVTGSVCAGDCWCWSMGVGGTEVLGVRI